MFGILFLLFTVIPALELFFLFKVGSIIGGMNTVFIVIITGIVGAAFAKSQGLSILAKIQHETQKGKLPGDEIIQGFMIFGGGLLLITPGFMTDIFGLSLVMPGTRHLLMSFVKAIVYKAMANGHVQFYSSNTGFYSNTETYHRSSNIDENTFEAEFREKE